MRTGGSRNSVILIDGVLDKLKTWLMKEDSEQLRLGVTFPHEMSPSTFLQRALDIEAVQ